MKYLLFSISFLFVLGPQDLRADSVVIQGIDAYNGSGPLASQTPTTSLDVVQDQCGEAPDLTPEEFNDDTIGVTVTNNSISTLLVDYVTFTVSNLRGHQTFRSRRIYPFTGFRIEKGKSSIVGFLFLDMTGTTKRYIGSSKNLSNYTGIKNIRVKVYAHTTVGRRYTLSGRATLSFDNFDNCTS